MLLTLCDMKNAGIVTVASSFPTNEGSSNETALKWLFTDVKSFKYFSTIGANGKILARVVKMFVFYKKVPVRSDALRRNICTEKRYETRPTKDSSSCYCVLQNLFSMCATRCMFVYNSIFTDLRQNGYATVTEKNQNCWKKCQKNRNIKRHVNTVNMKSQKYCMFK